MRVSNPIRAIVDQLDLSKCNPEKKLIPLSIGDPTKFGNMDTARAVSGAILSSVHTGMYNGYPPSDGFEESRQAVADLYTTERAPLTAADVSLTSGCSHALQMSIEVLCNPGDTLLIPNPGFPLYQTIADHLSVKCRTYELLPDKGWEADIEQLRSELVAEPVRGALLVNNPSNPCGSVYSKSHLEALLAVAEEFSLPVIADEIYADMVFDGFEYHGMAQLTDTVPVLHAGGMSKRYLVPGWRLGWVAAYDKQDILKKGKVLEGLKSLTQIIVGPNSLMQSIVPSVLSRTDPSFYNETMDTLKKHADFTVERLRDIPGLTPVQPQGAMYVMVALDKELFGVDSDVDFAQRLLEDQSVFVLPGACFGKANYFRIVTCPPLPVLGEAYDRLESFCNKLRTS